LRIISEIIVSNLFTDRLETESHAPISDVSYPPETQWVAWSLVKYRIDARGVERNSREFGFVTEM
jgi:hypothetical protein